jgi:hypothetical protein
VFRLIGFCRAAVTGASRTYHFGGPIGFRTSLIITNSLPLRPGQSADGVLVLSCKWTTKPGVVGGERGIDCAWPKNEDRNASASGGVLWCTEASDLEVHFIAE